MMTRRITVLLVVAAALAACTPATPAAQSPLPAVPVTAPLPAATVTPLPTPASTPPPPPTPVPTSFPSAGGTIAFIALSRTSRQSDIMLMNADGSNRHLLPNTSGAAAVNWSPDGKWLAYIVHHSDNDWSMYIVDADGKTRQRITQGNLDHFPSWSPDGTQIAFTRNGNIWVMRATDGSTVQVSDPRQLTTDPREDASVPAWSPDGTQIAFASQLGDPRGVAPYNDPKTAEIYVIKADGSDLQKLTDNQASDGNPAWSPDGRQIAFTSDREGKFQIYVMGATGSNVRRLTDDGANDISPAWSPDGQQIAFASDRDGQEYVYQLYKMSADGGNPTRLANTSTNDFGPAWRPAPAAPTPADWVNSGLQLGQGWGLALGDLNGDRYLDVALFHESAGNTIWLNDGAGGFAPTGQQPGYGYYSTLGDLDGDGDLDIFTVGRSHPGQVWLNDGAGRFVDSGQSRSARSCWEVALGDLNGDGHPDAVLALASPTRGARVLFNDGRARFSDSGPLLDGTLTHGIALGDIDGDGDLDIATAHGSEADDVGSGVKLWRNDGAGEFTAGDMMLGDTFSVGVALGDLDRDGDLDVALSHGDQPAEVWWN